MSEDLEFTRIELPTAGREDMIRSEAEEIVRRRYRAGRHRPEDHPDNFARKVKKVTDQILRETDLSTTLADQYDQESGDPVRHSVTEDDPYLQ